MRLVALVPHSYDGRYYRVGDAYEVDDPILVDTIIGQGMAATAALEAPPPAVAPVPVEAPPPAVVPDPPRPPHASRPKKHT